MTRLSGKEKSSGQGQRISQKFPLLQVLTFSLSEGPACRKGSIRRSDGLLQGGLDEAALGKI
jgi:hypothetical protein